MYKLYLYIHTINEWEETNIRVCVLDYLSFIIILLVEVWIEKHLEMLY